jgi:hypothetical protein
MQAGISMADRSFEWVPCQRVFKPFLPDAILPPENLVCDDCLKKLHRLGEGELRRQILERLARNPSRRSPELENAVLQFIQQYSQREGGE